MVVKFIVVDNSVLFGEKPFAGDLHAAIAQRNSVSKSRVRGGGLADPENRRIFGTSYGFGPYCPEIIRQLLPGWKVEQPSSY